MDELELILNEKESLRKTLGDYPGGTILPTSATFRASWGKLCNLTLKELAIRQNIYDNSVKDCIANVPALAYAFNASLVYPKEENAKYNSAYSNLVEEARIATLAKGYTYFMAMLNAPDEKSTGIARGKMLMSLNPSDPYDKGLIDEGIKNLENVPADYLFKLISAARKWGCSKGVPHTDKDHGCWEEHWRRKNGA